MTKAIGTAAAVAGYTVRFLLVLTNYLTPAVGPVLIWVGVWMYDPRLSWIVLGVLFMLPKRETK